MRGILATCAVIAVLKAGSALAAAPVGAGKVFTGSDGEQVAVIPLTPEDEKKAILLVQGTDTELDGKVLPHDIEKNGEDTRYVTQWHGRRYATLYLSVSGGGSRRKYYLHIPGRRDSTSVSFDDKRSQGLKPEDVYATYQKQKSSGSTAKWMAFDRKAEQELIDKGLASSVASMNEACGSQSAVKVDWATVTDEHIKERSMSGYCGVPLDSLRRLCGQSAEAKKIVQAKAKEVVCRVGGALALEQAPGRLTWTTALEASNQEDFATKYFTENLETTRGNGEKLATRMELEKLRVCTDGQGHYVVVRPHENQSVQLDYGDGKRFVKVAPPPWVISGYHFLEPRFYNKTMNHAFRGLDMGLYSEVEINDEKNTCAVRCGERSIPFKRVEADEAEKLVAAATFEPNPQKYVPYALLRDQSGRYYLVEKGFLPEDRSFRVSIGPKGDLKPQQMKDVVSDSKGEIFSTKRGDLRLLVDREAPSSWIEKKKKVELRAVPIEENLPLIYNELGVYTGARLGTPCDDQ
ncbi:hypothetical protein [Archangium primigenium]|uniref:hypothetical protein n=1 Tax=[Archangium] primigenium TaxID=2792470 RepID=UPI001EF87742|nr:hypothetical protein [Archangium primigenium]